MKNKDEQRRFLLTAGIGAVIYYVVLWAGTYFLRIVGLNPEDWYPVAVTAALVANTLSNFLLQKYWVFTNSDKKLWKGALPYIIVASIFIPLNAFLVWIVVEQTEVYVWLASALVAIVLIPPSFLINKWVLKIKDVRHEIA